MKDRFDLKWDAPNNGCPVNMYSMTITLTNLDQCMSLTGDAIQHTTSMTSYTFTNLLPHSTYLVEITPVNNAGSGSPLSMAVQTAETGIVASCFQIII